MVAQIVVLALFVALPGGVLAGSHLGTDMQTRVNADPCACLYQGVVLPSSIYNNYPDSEPGQYKNEPGVTVYGTSCAPHDVLPGTPWAKSCNTSNQDYGVPANNWCQEPWCYVDAVCSTAVKTDVFRGSTIIAYYSYGACGAPDCYTNQTSKANWSATGDTATPTSPLGGCPYRGGGTSPMKIFKTANNCACTYHGKELEADIYTNYPSGNPGQYKDLPAVQLYGTTCRAWDQDPGTPWFGSCGASEEFCSKGKNWCQQPWCYVASNCNTGVPTDVFNGSTSGPAFYSYDTCGAPDCYTDISAKVAAGTAPAGCPFETKATASPANWYTRHLTCPNGWTDTTTSTTTAASTTTRSAGVGAAVLVTLLAMVKSQ